ncbi:membrane-anchored junction protein isoform X2 [Phaenicophaeus curvirostris]|uniref:membrane-anchored junction protein isoform X2 n=1 Tax=Phaenicophaeus curvirostris TaxID=33595 RepID=UPI0037F0C616
MVRCGPCPSPALLSRAALLAPSKSQTRIPLSSSESVGTTTPRGWEGAGEGGEREKQNSCPCSAMVQENDDYKLFTSLVAALPSGIVALLLMLFLHFWFWPLQEAIRVILGNLDDLHPFSTDHFTVFPYLSKWERAWKMRFTHGNTRLTPYPYVCTLYLERNSFPQHGSTGTEGTTGREKLQSPHQTLPAPSCDGLKVRRSSETAGAAGEGSGQWSRVAAGAEPSCPQSGMDSAGAKCVPHLRKAKHRLEAGSYGKFRKSPRHLFGPRFSKCPAEKCMQGALWHQTWTKEQRLIRLRERFGHISNRTKQIPKAPGSWQEEVSPSSGEASSLRHCSIFLVGRTDLKQGLVWKGKHAVSGRGCCFCCGSAFPAAAPSWQMLPMEFYFVSVFKLAS